MGKPKRRDHPTIIAQRRLAAPASVTLLEQVTLDRFCVNQLYPGVTDCVP
jgi:hypothetical protein